jgi:hypothetical protein
MAYDDYTGPAVARMRREEQADFGRQRAAYRDEYTALEARKGEVEDWLRHHDADWLAAARGQAVAPIPIVGGRTDPKDIIARIKTGAAATADARPRMSPQEIVRRIKEIEARRAAVR